MFFMENLVTRLRVALDFANLPVRELERLAGLQRGTVAKIFEGESADPRSSTVIGCAVVLGTTADYLAGGIGDAPSERRVCRSVAEARQRLDDGVRHGRQGASRGALRKRRVTG